MSAIGVRYRMADWAGSDLRSTVRRMRLRTLMTSMTLVGVLAIAATACSSDSGAGASSGASSVGSTAGSVTTSADSVASATTGGVEDGSTCPKADGSSTKIVHFAVVPPTCVDPAKTYTATVTTNLGVITIALNPTAAPIAVNSFVFLAGYHYFDATICHRVINAFVIQCGDPTATGVGGPGYTFKDELPSAGSYQIGSLAMANSGANTNGSQFFIISGPQGVALPPKYSLFGQVSAGLDVVSAIDALGSDGDGAPMSPVQIKTVTIAVS